MVAPSAKEGPFPLSRIAHAENVPSHMRRVYQPQTVWRRALDESIKFSVGPDAHQDSIAVAACAAGREPSRFVGTLGPDMQRVLKTLRKCGPAR